MFDQQKNLREKKNNAKKPLIKQHKKPTNQTNNKKKL